MDFSSRTVISPDPNLHIDEVGVPIFVAKILTYPQRVCQGRPELSADHAGQVFEHNLEAMRALVRNGPDGLPNAPCAIASRHCSPSWRKLPRERQQRHQAVPQVRSTRRGRAVICSTAATEHPAQIAKSMQIGDIVERHLIDGDVVLFNRQPSLHKLSIMCHHVCRSALLRSSQRPQARVMPWRTFRFNESVCTPYNADFDGDEMNLHVPQTDEARAEAHVLMNVGACCQCNPRSLWQTINNICTPRNGEPLISATQVQRCVCWHWRQLHAGLYHGHLLADTEGHVPHAQRSKPGLRRDNACQLVLAHRLQLTAVLSDGNVHVKIPPPAIVRPMQLWTGKQITGLILRHKASSNVVINLETEGRNYSPVRRLPAAALVQACAQKSCIVPGPASVLCSEDSYIVIRNSVHMCGQLEKVCRVRVLGAGQTAAGHGGVGQQGHHLLRAAAHLWRARSGGCVH